MFTSIARLFQAWKRQETVRRELSHLSDRELADIGITHSDIDRIAEQEAHKQFRTLLKQIAPASRKYVSGVA